MRSQEIRSEPTLVFSRILDQCMQVKKLQELGGKTGRKDDREQFLLFVYGQEECLFPPATPEKVITHGALGRALLVGSH